MDKLHILTIVLVSCGIAFMTVSLGTGIKSLLEGNWIYYAYSTTVSTTYLGNPATVVAVATANIGLYTTCYNIDTTTTVTTFLGTSTTSLNTNACVDSDSTGYISAGLFTLDAYESSSYRKMICFNMEKKTNFMHHAKITCNFIHCRFVKNTVKVVVYFGLWYYAFSTVKQYA